MTKTKLLLQKTWPHVLAKKMNDKILLGNIHLIDTDCDKGLVWNTLTNEKLMEITTLKEEEILSLTVNSVFKVRYNLSGIVYPLRWVAGCSFLR